MTLCSSFPSSSCSALFSGGRLYRSKEEFFLLRGEEFRRNQFDGRLRENKKCGDFSSVLLSQQQQQSCCFERDFRVRVVLFPFASLSTSVSVDYYCGGSFAGLNCNNDNNKGRTRTRDLGFGVKCRVGSAVRDLETEDSAREDGIGSRIRQEDEDEENIQRISSSSGVQLASGRRSEVAGETDGDFVLGSTNGAAQIGAYFYGDGDDSEAAAGGGGGGGILSDAMSRLVQEEEKIKIHQKDVKNDVEDDESATSITRIPVPRQKYIAVSKVELVSTLLSSCPSSKEASALLEIFSCLESVLHAEHKGLLEELRMDYRLAQSSLEDEMSSSSSSTSKAASSENNHTMKAAGKQQLQNWWKRFARKIRVAKPQASGEELQTSTPGRQDNAVATENGNALADYSSEHVMDETAAERFQRHFMRILRRAKFEGLSVGDLKLTAALNSDYLLTLPIDVDWKSAASADALLFRRGYSTERQEGYLFGAKLDYLQSVFLLKLFNGLTGPLFRAGRWCIKKWESLEEDEEGRALTERIERWLEEPLHPGANQSAKPAQASSDDEHSNSDGDEEGLEIWKAARQAVPRYQAVLSSAGARGLLLRRVLERMGLLSAESPTLSKPPDAENPALEPHMRPKMLTRVSMRDIWRPASKVACGNNIWRQLQASFSIFFSQSTLQEPAFQELVLLYGTAGNETDENGLPRLQLHTYTKIPLPDLKVVFPSKKLSFRVLDTVRLDLATLAGLVAFLVSHRFDDLLSSPSAFALDVIASISLIVYVTRVALGYKQTYDRYQLLVNRTLYEKTLASGFGVVHFLMDASEEQQFKGAILVYSLLFIEGKSQSMSIQDIAKVCERYLYKHFREQVEMPMHEIVQMLLKLGLVVQDKGMSSNLGTQEREEDIRISLVPDGQALGALKEQWLTLMSKQSIWNVR
ncbi:unnamed protein product [Sphagnum jensenii]|uniref:Uncharacterized protein n=1 Tax=Sphagnum jensenii TaxID=128206 RepID=A0ABP1BNE6_9BRYO